ncbi:putative DNA binding domain-containing protein [Corynebacterium sp. MSK044]|uniref:RNA-binding domain-containing protein n=1 Tax=Corynebacterium sp. MSK044 TaxID=3050195 RepID=UPI00254ADD8F|nr:RNA-binding domain-containing protein [Corynebacterium sp. MSK044]MDK8797691.1 putative DNA binding domain-containing protein [Corynebacterium sp. MSK044]
MLDAGFENVEEALSAIEAGDSARNWESQVLDFKEDPAVHPKNKNPDARLVEFLVDEVICFSNADGGVAYIVLGVNDKKAGPSAFTGTDRPCEWLVEKIYSNTQPHIQVEAFAIQRCDARLVVLRIPRGMALYQRPKGQASKRVGKSCVPLTEDVRRGIHLSRSNPDLSAGKSWRGPEDLNAQAVERAKALLANRKSALGDTSPVPQTGLELCSELGLLTSDGALTFAAEILFMQPVHNRTVVRHLLRVVPSGDPKVTEISAPLITASEQVRALIKANTTQEIARVQLPNGQEFPIPAFPATAVDEIVSNAFAHRDWGATTAIVIDQSPTSLTVWSPGGFPVGVAKEKILTTQSIPRNPVLMAALRQLGLAEESSRGFDRMWVSMLSSGRQAPSLNANGPFVEVTLPSGSVDSGFIRALYLLRTEFGESIFDSVNGLLVTRHLANNQILMTSTAARLMQVSDAQAQETLAWYASQGFLEQLRDAPEWILSARARAAFDGETSTVVSSVTTEDWVLAQLREGKSLNAREVADELGVEREAVSRLLRHLRDIGKAKIAGDSPTRGPSVRWVSA